MIPIDLYTKTDIGKERITNEDSVASLILNSSDSDNKFLCAILVVADGMGGHDMGDVASTIASNKFLEVLTNSIIRDPHSQSRNNYEEILKRAIDLSNTEVWKISQKRPKPIGTTLVGAIITDYQAFIVNVGDSRAYLINPSKSIVQITKDHTAVQEMVDGGVISKEQAINHPRRNIITRALGLADSISADLFKVNMKEDTLLLCSDGLYGMVDNFKILKTIKKDITKSAETLISLANKNGGNDNISIALARYF